MTRQRSHPASRRFVPRLEALEDRALPAVNFFVFGSTLVIAGPTTSPPPPEHLTIFDNGSGSANNVTVANRQMFSPNVPITDIIVALHGGHDGVTYALTGNLTVPRTLTVNLSGGHSHFDAILRRNLVAASLQLNVHTSGPNDLIQTEVIGNVLAGSSLLMNYSELRGDNRIQVITSSAVTVDPGSLIQMDLYSGSGSGNIVADYQGVLNGFLGIDELTGKRNSHLLADIELRPGSTGTVLPSEIHGGRGNDFLTFIIHNPGTASANNEILDGDGGFNVAVRTSNVDAFNVQRDTIIP